MANTTTTPFMLMVLPVPGVEVGPQWAQELIAALTAQLDPHDHSDGKGTFVTPAGLNLNQDLDFADRDTGNPQNARNVRALTFESLSAALSEVTDRNSFFVVGVDVYFLDGDGNAIQITSGGSVLVAAGNISGMADGAAVSYSTLAKVFTFIQSPGVSAGMDFGSVRIREEVGAGKGVSLQAPIGLAGDYNWIFPAALPAGGEIRLLLIDDAGNVTCADDPTITSRLTAQGINPGDTADTTAGNIRVNGGVLQGYIAGVWRTLGTITASAQFSAGVVDSAAIAVGAVNASNAATGSSIGYAASESTAHAQSQAVIPNDDTVPQITEGVEFLTAGYAPQKIGNTICVRAVFHVGIGSTSVEGTIALFKDAVANAVAVSFFTPLAAAATRTGVLVIEYREIAASLAVQTWRVRGGTDNGGAAGAMWTNGDLANRKYGGVSRCSLSVTEYAQ